MNSEGGEIGRFVWLLWVFSSFRVFFFFTFLLTRISLSTPIVICIFKWGKREGYIFFSLSLSLEFVWISLRPYMSFQTHREKERWNERDYRCDKYWNSGRGMSSAVFLFFFLFGVGLPFSCPSPIGVSGIHKKPSGRENLLLLLRDVLTRRRAKKKQHTHTRVHKCVKCI